MPAAIGTSFATTPYNSTAASVTLTPPTSSAGNFLILAAAGATASAAVSVSTPTGWTALSSGGAPLAVFWKTAAASELPVIINFSAACAGVAIAASFPAITGSPTFSLPAASASGVASYSPAFPGGVTASQFVLLLASAMDSAAPSGAANFDFPVPGGLWAWDRAPIGPAFAGTSPGPFPVALGLASTNGPEATPVLTSATGSLLRGAYVLLSFAGPTILTQSLPEAVPGVFYSQTMQASGNGPFTWSFANVFPPGITMDVNGNITGTPTAVAAGNSYPVIITARDVNGLTASVTITLQVATAAQLAISSGPPPPVRQNAPYFFQFTEVNGAGTVRWAITSGSLPLGMSLDGPSGSLTGTASIPGAYGFSVTVTDSAAHTATASYVLQVSPGLGGGGSGGVQLPDTIPAQIGSLQAPPGALEGNGWEVRVLSHTDFSTLVCYLPSAYTSLQFAKLLSDKGSMTIILNEDDPTLFPPDVLSLNASPDFTALSFAGWEAVGGTASVGTPPPGSSFALGAHLTPTGTLTTAYVAASGAPFAVIPGQSYITTAQVFSSTGYANVVAGMVFLDAYGVATVVFSPGQQVGANVWTVLYGQATAPVGAVTGFPLVGETSTPGSANSLWVTLAASSYESTEYAGTPGSVTLGDFLLDHEHLYQIWWNGMHVFDATGQSVTEQLVDQSEQRVATVTGPGTANVLSWGRAMPPGFPRIVFKTDAIQDGFAEADTQGNPALDVNIWNRSAPLDHITLNPLGTCQLTASPGTTFLGGYPYDITTSSISAQVNPIAPLGGNVLDGSQVTQFYVQDNANTGNYALFGVANTTFYVQVGDTVAGVNKTKLLAAYDPNVNLYWRISEGLGTFYFWTSADGLNWVQQWKMPVKWVPNNLSVFFTAKYDQDGAAIAGVTNVNGDIVTPSSAGNIFLLTPIMSVWKQLFDQAQARGTFPWISTRLTSLTDSFGNPWTDAMSVQIQNGTDMLSLLTSHVSIVDADWVMQPGFVLQVGLPVSLAGGVSLGRDLSRQVILRESVQPVQLSRTRARDQVQNSYGAVNSDGTVVTGQDAASIQAYQQREGWAQTALTVNPKSMDIVVAASLAETKDEILTKTISILPEVEGATPFADFDVGDWVGLERPGPGANITDAVRVAGIAMAADSTGATTCEVTLVTYLQARQEQLAYLVSKFGGQFINALGTTPVTSTSSSTGAPPTVVAPSITGLSPTPGS